MSGVRIIQTDGSEFGFGTMTLPNRKKPYLYTLQGQEIIALATFRSPAAATTFDGLIDRLLAMLKTGRIVVTDEGEVVAETIPAEKV